jgi:hypothetical protein
MVKRFDNPAAEAEATARMVREEVILRPARRAAAFCAIVVLGLAGTTFASGSADQAPGAGFEIRAEIAGGQPANLAP